MAQIRVLQSYVKLSASLKNPADLAYEEDRAVADFRGFYQVGTLHATRVRSPLAINTMLEILENLQNDLEKALQKTQTM